MALRRTFPDWGSAASAITSPDIDAAEIPARLGSPSLLRRTGKVIFYDTFSISKSGLWFLTNATVVTDPIYFGDGSIRLTPNVADNGRMKKNFPSILTKKYGIEFYAAYNQGLDTLVVNFNKYSGTTLLLSQIILDFATGNVQVVTTGGSYVTIGTFNPNNVFTPGSPPIWTNFKITYDLSNNTYAELYINDTTITINLPLYNSGATIYDFVQCEIVAIDAAFAASAYISGFILTIDEP